MIKKACIFTAFIAMCQTLSAGSAQSLFYRDPPAPESSQLPLSVTSRLNKTELRAAAFYPASHRFRSIYGHRGLSLQAEGARGLKKHPNLEIWENFEWIFMHGKVHPDCGRSGIDMINISAGLKGIGPVWANWLYLYLGLGANLGIIYLENKIHCASERFTTHKSYLALGGVLKSGAQVYLTPTIYLSAFADYLYLPVSMHQTVDVGGFKVGGGLGARF
jgi:hypothetical protein